MEFWCNCCFRESSLRNYKKELSIASYPDSHDFVLFEIVQVYLRLADCRVYKGHLQNEWAIKPFRKYPKSNKFVCVKSSLQFMHNVYPFLQIPGYLEIPLTDFCETSHRERQAPIKYAQWDSKMKGAATELLCRATLKAPAMVLGCQTQWLKILPMPGFDLLSSRVLAEVSIWYNHYSAFHKHANSEVQKTTDDCNFRCRQSS